MKSEFAGEIGRDLIWEILIQLSEDQRREDEIPNETFFAEQASFFVYQVRENYF